MNISVLKQNWTLDRILRLVIGILLLSSGWVDGIWWIMGIGAFLAYQGLSNTGCQSATCELPSESETQS